MIGNGTMMDMLAYFVGNPQNDLEHTIQYIVANVLVTVLFFSVVAIIYVLVSSVKR